MYTPSLPNIREPKPQSQPENNAGSPCASSWHRFRHHHLTRDRRIAAVVRIIAHKLPWRNPVHTLETPAQISGILIMQGPCHVLDRDSPQQQSGRRIHSHFVKSYGTNNHACCTNSVAAAVRGLSSSRGSPHYIARPLLFGAILRRHIPHRIRSGQSFGRCNPHQCGQSLIQPCPLAAISGCFSSNRISIQSTEIPPIVEKAAA